jgi:putative heme-binding domain-containing protein
VQIVRREGAEVYGIVTNQSPEAITIASAPNTPPVSIPRGEIQALSPASFSLMPQGFDQVLSAPELADVVAYLQSMR